jgi:hypothetical protein
MVASGDLVLILDNKRRVWVTVRHVSRFVLIGETAKGDILFFTPSVILELYDSSDCDIFVESI